MIRSTWQASMGIPGTVTQPRFPASSSSRVCGGLVTMSQTTVPGASRSAGTGSGLVRHGHAQASERPVHDLRGPHVRAGVGEVQVHPGAAGHRMDRQARVPGS